jgi:thiol-disulfide isomerase/thioredoxin
MNSHLAQTMQTRRLLSIYALAICLALISFSTVAQQSTKPKTVTLRGVDAMGKTIDLADYAGKTVLISFYTGGCNLCTRDLKLMREFYADNLKNKFVLLAVNMDKTKTEFDSYNQLIALTIPEARRFPSVWRNAPGHVDSFGAITRQPTHFVINSKGEFVSKREGTFQPSDWDALWEQLGN